MSKEQFEEIIGLLNKMGKEVCDIEIAASCNCPCDSNGYEEAEAKLVDYLKSLVIEKEEN